MSRAHACRLILSCVVPMTPRVVQSAGIRLTKRCRAALRLPDSTA